MAKKLAYYVHVDDDQGEPHTFGPDDKVPGWAVKKITNPSAWADEAGADATAADPDPDPEPEVKPYQKWKKGDLEDEVAARNKGRDEDDLIVVEGNGTVKDLATALDADDEAADGDE